MGTHECNKGAGQIDQLSCVSHGALLPCTPTSTRFAQINRHNEQSLALSRPTIGDNRSTMQGLAALPTSHSRTKSYKYSYSAKSKNKQGRMNKRNMSPPYTKAQRLAINVHRLPLLILPINVHKPTQISRHLRHLGLLPTRGALR